MNAQIQSRFLAGRPFAVVRQQGFSMIEMLISVAIGLMVTGAVLYTVSSAGVSGRKQEVQSTMHDLGNLAMVQLAEHLRMSGFSVPSSEVAAGDVFNGGENSIFGCRQGFASGTGAWTWNDLACDTGSRNANDAIALRFQVQKGGRNWDCLGNSVEPPNPAAGSGANSTGAQNTEIQEKFYLRTTGTASGNPGLFCSSSITPNAEQLIADNVDQMTIRYGVSVIKDTALTANRAFDEPVLEGRTGMYRRADAMDPECTPGALGQASWCAVNTVQVCLVMRSENNVNDEPNTPYVNCEGEVATANDRRLRQAFTMTIAVRNKIVR